MNFNCSNTLYMRNLQEQVKKAFCYQKLFWPLTVWINCSSDLKIFANSWTSASNFKSFSQSTEQFFLAVGRNNFGNKVPFLTVRLKNTFNSIGLHLGNWLTEILGYFSLISPALHTQTTIFINAPYLFKNYKGTNF